MLHGPVSIPFHSRNPSLNAVQIRASDATVVVAQLLFLEAEETSKPIHLYINSPGGVVTAGLAIYDTVRTIEMYQNCFLAENCRCRLECYTLTS